MTRSTVRLLTLLLLLSAGAGGACSSRPAASPPTGRQLVDDLGRDVRIAERPERIVSLSPNLTEILYALGAGDRVAANTSYCDYPPEAREKPHVGDTQRPDLERIVALEPDLVLVPTASQLQSLVERLDGLGLPTYVAESRDLDGVFRSIERIGDAIGDREAGRDLAARLRARTEAVSSRVGALPAPRVFVVVGDEPLFTAGRGTFVDDLVRRAGGASISGDEATEWPQYSAETVIARAPEVIVVPLASHGVSEGGESLPVALRETPAARDGRIVRIDGDLLMRPGPRLVDGLEALARALHPEAGW
jgi:iron complex transport system substrate-binding protein